MDIDEVIEKAQEIADKDSSCWMYCDCVGVDCDICKEQNAQLAEWLTKLKEYQDLEEQGRLIKLPCKIGDDVYFVPSLTNYRLNILNHHGEENKICHQKITRITFSRNGWYLECDKDLEYATDRILVDKMYKETWFLAKAEAEAKLKELRGGKNESNN